MKKQREPIPCAYCGKMFIPKRTQVYCSLECRRTRTNELKRQRTNFKREAICPVCGKPFLKNSAIQRYCSHECYYKEKGIRDGQFAKRFGLEVTKTGIYLIHKWSSEGMNAETIAKILGRSEQNVKEILDVELSDQQKAMIGIYSNPQTIELYSRQVHDLANAIVLQAVDDYRKAMETLDKNPNNDRAKETLAEVFHFMQSPWYSQLTDLDGMLLFQRLKAEPVGEYRKNV